MRPPPLARPVGFHSVIHAEAIVSIAELTPADRAAWATALDELDPPAPDVFGALGFEPLCKPRVIQRLAGVPEAALPPLCGQCPQERFLALPDENLDVLYGGAGGGSKSFGMFAYAIRSCVRYPGLQAFWFRETFPQLNQSVLRTLARYGYCRRLGARWNGSNYELRFPGENAESILTFAHAKNLKEASALSSAEINLLIIDERTLMLPEVADFLYTRVRSGVQDVPCLGVRAGSNPGNVGHQVVKEGWVDATDQGKKEIIDAAGRRRIFIPAKVSDNPYIKDYAETLKGITDPDLKRRILDGDWSVMPNQAFPDWRPHRIIVPAFDLPETWQRYGGMDYGWTAPSVFLAAAKDNDGRLWFYREITMRQTPEREQARSILSAAPEVRYIAGDPAMWGKAGSAMPPALQMITEGLPLQKADNDRLGGKSRIHTYLAEVPACSYHRELGWTVCPMLHILDGSCPEFVATMPSLPRDPRRPEDVDTNANDHYYDGVRYLALSIGGGPEFYIEPDPDPSAVPQLHGMPPELLGQPLGPRIAVLSNPDGTQWQPSDPETRRGQVVTVNGS